MRRLLRTLTAVYLVASVFAWFPSGASASVLCFEPDGRVAVEEGANRCAGLVTPRSRALYSSIEEIACGRCVDVRLGGPEGRPALRAAAVQPPAPATSAVLPSDPVASLAHPGCSRDEAAALARAPDPPQPTRTTILRN